MRILLDESLPIELRSEIAGHEVRYDREMGWSGLKNGELLTQAAALFEVLVTADQNLEYQQNLDTLPIAVSVLVARSNRIEQLRPLLPRLVEGSLLSSRAPSCELKPRPNHAFNRTRRYGPSTWRSLVAAGRLTWSC
jgi:hypothetical protein